MFHEAYLEITDPDGIVSSIVVEKDSSLFVGTGPNCRLVLDDPSVNDIHCRIWMDKEGELSVEDWNTDGHTILNQEPICNIMPMKIHDSLQIGAHKLIRVRSLDPNEPTTVEAETADQKSTCEVDIEIPVENCSGDSADQGVAASADDYVASADQCAVKDQGVQALQLSVPPALQSETSQQVGETAPFSPPAPPQKFIYDINLDEDDDDEFVPPLPLNSGARNDEDAEDGLLTMEVDQLRFELAQRDEQIRTLIESQSGAALETLDDDDTSRLVDRLEELLVELQSSDDRVRGLEELLRASDQATQAEQEERLQLESWVGEIEQRVADRESESKAEMDRLRQRMADYKQQYRQIQQHLNETLESNGVSPDDATPDQPNRLQELSQALQTQVENLQAKLDAAGEENETLQKKIGGNEIQIRESLKSLQQDFMELQVKTSQERAEMARQKEQLVRAQDDLAQQLATKKQVGEGDSRIRAMREHLREIQLQETQEREERKSNSLSGRISRLLTRTN